MNCPKLTNAQKKTPLHYAAIFNRCEIVEFLVGEGAEINAVDNQNRSPLLSAASYGGWRTVNTLFRLGARIFDKDNRSRNFLHLIVMNGGEFKDFRQNLLQFQFKGYQLQQLLNEQDNAGCTVLHYALQMRFQQLAIDLIDLGALINLKNNNNSTVLHCCAELELCRVIKTVTSSQIGLSIINEQDTNGMTPLHFAAKYGHEWIVAHLLDNGASLTQRDYNQRNPLHLAAMYGHVKIIVIMDSTNSKLRDETDEDGVKYNNII